MPNLIFRIRPTVLKEFFSMIFLSFESLFHIESNTLVVDTFNLPIASAIFKIFGLKTISYAHYPLVQKKKCESLRRVFYHVLLYKLYESSTFNNGIVFVNSMWTHYHIPLCCRKHNIVLYPPSNIRDIPENFKGKTISSLGQFRPEKRHEFQLELSSKLECKDVNFNIIGSYKTEEENSYVSWLKLMAKDSSVNTHFALNASLKEVEEFFSSTRVGLHTMIEEHFGIAVFEMLVIYLLKFFRPKEFL